MELYYFRGAPCAYKVQLLIAELGSPVDQREITRDDLTSDFYLKLNPKGIVPTLVDGEQVIVESSTIMRFLDSLSGGKSQPSDSHLQARMNSWMKFMDEELHPAMGYIAYGGPMRDNFLALGPQELEARFQRTSASVAVMAMRLDSVRLGTSSIAFKNAIEIQRKLLADAEQSLQSGPWLAGPEYSMADAAVTPAMMRLEQFGFQAWWERKFPKATEWWANIKSRPSFQKVYFEDSPDPATDRYREAGVALWPIFQSNLREV